VTAAHHVVLDTDAASLGFKRRLSPTMLAQLIDRDVCLTFVTVAGLTQWADLRRWGARNRELLGRWMSRVVVLPYDEDVAATWGHISAAAIQRGRPARRTTLGSPPAAWCTGCRWRPATRRTSPTTPNTRASS
jgi:predicted nucleic acid-binding protein